MQTHKVKIEATTVIPRWGCVTDLGALANSNIPGHQGHIIGVTDGRMEPNHWGDVVVLGVVYDQFWTWTPGGLIYLNGTVLSQTAPGFGFVQEIAWALTGQSILVDIMGGTGAPGPPGPAGPICVIIRDTWSPLPPGSFGPTDGNPAVDTICVYRDGGAWKTWDATFAVWLL